MGEYELSEPEIELLNLLRGHGEPGWFRLTIGREPDGRWLVEQLAERERKVLGKGEDFDSAWIMQCVPELQEPLTEDEVQRQPPRKPSLRLVRSEGGDDNG